MQIIITNVGMQMYCCTQQKQAQLFCERFVQLKAKGAEDTFLPAKLVRSLIQNRILKLKMWHKNS